LFFIQFSKFLHIPAKGTEDIDYLENNYRPLESIYSPLEDLRKYPKSVAEANRKIRLNRVVLKSILSGEVNQTIEANYDYERGANFGTQFRPSSMPIFFIVYTGWALRYLNAQM